MGIREVVAFCQHDLMGAETLQALLHDMGFHLYHWEAPWMDENATEAR